MSAYYHTNFFIDNLFVESSSGGLSGIYIGVVGTLIAILFTILITIVANSSAKYPTNFIEQLKNDLRTRVFYFSLVAIMLIETALYHLGYNSLAVDLIFVLLVFIGLFWYWNHILSFIDPIASVRKLANKKIIGEEISTLGDYAEIGVKNKNEKLTQESISRLINIHERLKK